MQRTESKPMQVHPAHEQQMINVMQEFGWNLKSSQEIKIANQKITGTSSSYNSFTGQVHTRVHTRNESEHYIKLVFERPYDFPNRDRLVQLENEYFSLRFPPQQSLTAPVLLIFAAFIVMAIKLYAGILFLLVFIGAIYLITKENNKKKALCEASNRRRQEIIAEATPLSLN